MTAVPLFRDTNIAANTSRENTLYALHGGFILAHFSIVLVLIMTWTDDQIWGWEKVVHASQFYSWEIDPYISKD